MAASSKRARVMARSRQLGHCICDPRKLCPCDQLREQNVCSCAGERPRRVATAETPRLTQLVKHTGCASKIPPGELARVLARLPVSTDPRLLVGSATADDAGVFQLSPDLCLVQTVDVFTPCVDDPYTFGRIAACNSLSDVYAMGGKPLTALSVLAYPVATLGDEWMYQLLKGGLDQLTEVGVTLVGGHSIDDEEVKFGFAVTGTVSPRAMVTNAGARPGDALILTKPIGTGIIGFAAQLGRASEVAQAAAMAAMTRLNRGAAEVMVRHGARACTDVTGFGLLGHLLNIVRESRVEAEVWWEAVPLLPEVAALAAAGVVSGAAERNREYVTPRLQVGETVPEYVVDLLCDPQTSGGLLFALPAAKADLALRDLRAAGCAEAAVIGRVTGEGEGRMVVTERQEMGEEALPIAEACCAAEAECCPTPGEAVPAPGASQAFQQFMAAALRPGALDVVQKELITIALSVAVQCEPCLRTHLTKAQAMGITREELEEAAWLGVAFGGCKAMMFWNGLSAAFWNQSAPTSV